nr:hypothetical protein BaRGS_019715 [Batillaria attramentaria]
MVQKLLRELAIDAQQTSLNKRKSKSIPDNRVSATTIGCMGIGVLVTVIGVIVIMDMTNFLRRPARTDQVNQQDQWYL